MPIDLSFIRRGVPPLQTAGSGDTPPDPQTDDVAHVQAIMQALGPIMQSMEPTPTATAPILPSLPSGGQQVMGSLGDALTAFAQARLGHSPQRGQFATDMQQTEKERLALQNKYLESNAAQAAADRNERNRIRAQAGLVGMRAGERAPKNLQHYQEEGVDAQGNPTSQTMSFDPATGTKTPIGEPRRTFLKPTSERATKVQKIGDKWYKIDDQGNLQGTIKDPATGSDISAIPSTQTVQELNMLDRITENVGHMRDVMNKIKSRGPVSRGLGTVAASGGMIGRAVASYQDPDIRDYMGKYKVATGNLNSFNTGQNRLIVGEIPLTQADIPSSAEEPGQAITKLESTLSQVAEKKAQLLSLYPALNKMGQPAAAGSTPTQPYAGITLHEADFATAAPGEKERFMAGGGKVEP